VAGLLGIKFFLAKKALFKAWFSSALAIVAATFYGVIGLYPNMFPSNIDTAYSLTAHNSASSDLTLKIMLVVVIMFVPIILIYQAWTYHLFKGKVKQDDMAY
jgi:cytochrome d ubiquinol oxidase subunit II